MVRSASIQAALDGYERAAISGLRREGAWEVAIIAIRMVDREAALGSNEPTGGPPRT